MPWRFLEKGATLVAGPVVLYWLPASRAEVERSPLLTSRVLLDGSVRCVGLKIVLPDDAATIDKLGATGKLPAALLADRRGNVIRRVDNVRGALPPASVEQMVHDELSARDESVYKEITEARKRASAGDKERAIELYRKIWDERCLFPLVGREAQQALASLGVTVKEPPATRPVDPNLPAPAKTATRGDR